MTASCFLLSAHLWMVSNFSAICWNGDISPSEAKGNDTFSTSTSGQELLAQLQCELLFPAVQGRAQPPLNFSWAAAHPEPPQKSTKILPNQTLSSRDIEWMPSMQCGYGWSWVKLCHLREREHLRLQCKDMPESLYSIAICWNQAGQWFISPWEILSANGPSLKTRWGSIL